MILTATNTYTGTTTISAGSLQLGTGAAGQDGFINSSTSIVDNSALVFNYFAAQTVPATITTTSYAGSFVQNGSQTLTLAGAITVGSLVFNNTGSLSGGTLNLPSLLATSAAPSLINNAAGVTTISSSVSIGAGGGGPGYWSSSPGTLNIAGAVNQASATNFFLDSGNFTLPSGGTITVPNGAAVLNDVAGSTTNFTQTGGLFSDACASGVPFYFSQGGTVNYNMTGGTLKVVGAATGAGVLDFNYTSAGSTGNLTINGPAAVVATPQMNLVYSAAVTGSGSLRLQNGTLQTDYLYTTVAAHSTFLFSGGTLQPLDSGAGTQGWGNSTVNDLTATLSGANAVMSSNDAAGVGRTVPVYLNLSGAGNLTTGGSGTLVLLGNNNNDSGQITISSGTVQIGSSLAGTAGTMAVSGGSLDLKSNSFATGTIALLSGSIIDSTGGGVLNASAYTLQGGTASAVLGGAFAPLNKTTAGLALLTAANTYGGPTTVSAGTLALVPRERSAPEVPP